MIWSLSMAKIKYIETLITIVELAHEEDASICTRATRPVENICLNIVCSYCVFDKARKFDQEFKIPEILKRNNT